MPFRQGYRARGGGGRKCFYRLLEVSQTATPEEIKTSFRKLALQYHPDRHDGCTEKVAQFKQINEAYNVLIDVNQRREYDHSIGNVNFSSNYYRRKGPLPKDYRKVYAPSPPPDWKRVWNHREHYEMHYGDGFLKQAVEQMRKSAEREGQFQYKSPLGKGFAFADEGTWGGRGGRTTSTNRGGSGYNRNETSSSSSDNANFSSSDSSSSSDEHINRNPYSKSPQGPPQHVFEYEEHDVQLNFEHGGRQNLQRRERIVNGLQERRNERLRQQQQGSTGDRQPKQQQRGGEGEATPDGTNHNLHPAFAHATGGVYGNQPRQSPAGGGGNECVIL